MIVVTGHIPNFIYIDIPKNASTSISHILENALPGAILGGMPHGNIEQAYKIMHINDINPKDVFSFAVCRNPYDRLVSEFFFSMGVRCNISKFEEWFDREHPMIKRPREFNPWEFQYPYVMDVERSRILVDHVCRYEKLIDELSVLFFYLNIPYTFSQMPHALKTNHLHYSFYFQNEAFRQKVQDYYQKDFELFEYDTKLEQTPTYEQYIDYDGFDFGGLLGYDQFGICSNPLL